ncbi:MAG TPA: xanthine dehydrogenase small subunit [Beijerinckiaceae bacterium]
MRGSIRFLRRGRVVETSGFTPRTTLLDHLRLTERSLGTKEGCAEGDCGACTVVLARRREGRLAYEPVNACILLLGQVDGAEVITVEDLAGEEALHPVQAAMVAHHGSQCGFCTPGIVMSLFALHHGPRPVGREAADDALAGNLCRCTGYRPIVDAALEACAAPPRDRFAERRAATQAALAALDDGADLFVGDETRFFAAPATEDALSRLYEAYPDATLVAGCTDVGLWITKAMAEIDKVIWLGRVKELDRIEDGADALSLGATVTHARAHAALASLDPDLGELMRRFGGAQVRAAGTVGGNIANGSPIGDLAPALLALEATLELRKGAHLRALPLDNFFLAYRRQDRAPGEFVRRVIVRKLRSSEAFRCHKVSKRFDEDISAVMGAFRLSLDGRRITQARIAYGGMAEIPKRAGHAEAALAGAILDDEGSWEAALSALSRDFTPLTDHRASASYRALAARNLLFKTLTEIAAGDTRETRIAGRRELQAAE